MQEVLPATFNVSLDREMTWAVLIVSFCDAVLCATHPMFSSGCRRSRP
jgi:hypothetical protein